MKYIIAIFVLLLAATTSANDWDSSPDNWENTNSNWDNSSDNWENSPQNWENSPQNWGNDRVVYDEDGEATGYVVPKKSGGVNIYDLDGERKAYTPADSSNSYFDDEE